MKTYVALLRGINVSGQKKIRMVDLKASLDAIGLRNVTTYIQSGNIVFQSDETKLKNLEQQIHDAVLQDFEFEVPTLVLNKNELEAIVASNPFAKNTNEKGLYFVLLKSTPDEALVSEFNSLKFQNEDFFVTPKCVYLNCKTGYGKAKLNNNVIERKLQVEATTRNLKTMLKLLEMMETIKD